MKLFCHGTHFRNISIYSQAHDKDTPSQPATLISFSNASYYIDSTMSGFFPGFGGSRGGPARSNPYTLQAYPRLIEPETPDYARCVPEFGRELAKRDCKEAVKNMPWLRSSAEVDWAVNFKAQQYNLPMSIGWTVPKGEAGAGTPGMYT